jgi:cell division protein FtsB
MRKLLLFLVIVLSFLQFRLWFGDSNLLELEGLKQRVEELKQRARERKERNTALEAEIMDLKRGTDAIEERARFDLGMIRQGEHFIQVLENPLPENSTPENSTPENSAPENKKANRSATPKIKPKQTPKSIQHVDAKTLGSTGNQHSSDHHDTDDE